MIRMDLLKKILDEARQRKYGVKIECPSETRAINLRHSLYKYRARCRREGNTSYDNLLATLEAKEEGGLNTVVFVRVAADNLNIKIFDAATNELVIGGYSIEDEAVDLFEEEGEKE